METRIGPAAIVNLPHPPRKKTEKKRKKAQKQGREGSNPLIWRPNAVNSTLLIVNGTSLRPLLQYVHNRTILKSRKSLNTETQTKSYRF